MPDRLGRGLALFLHYSVTQADSHSYIFIPEVDFPGTCMGIEHIGMHVGGFNGLRLKTAHATPARVSLARTWSQGHS